MTPAWTVQARNADRTVTELAELKGWTLAGTLRRNQIGSLKLTIGRELCPAGWPHPGCRLVAMYDGQVVASGTADDHQFDQAPASAQSSSSSTAGPGVWSLAFDTDLARPAQRIVYPSYDRAWASQTVTAQYVDSGNAETILRRYVDRQAGPSALAARRAAGLVLGPANSPLAGTSTQTAERFTDLLDAMRAVALAGGDLTFDVLDQLDGTLAFVVSTPRDLTATVQFGLDRSNVSAIQVHYLAPAGTVALVAGQGEGTARSMLEVAGSSTFPERREIFVDQRQTSDPVEYLKAGQQAVDEAGEQTAISAMLVDVPGCRWMTDYRLGDRVSIATDGGSIADVVQEVDFTVDATGLHQVTGAVGTTQTAVDNPSAKTIRRLLQQLAYASHN